MVTSVLAAAVPSLVSAGVSLLGKSLSGGGDKGASQAPLQNFQPPGFQGGGFGTKFGANGLTITPTAERLGAVRGIQDVFGGLASELGGLRSKVAPGISDLRASRLGEIENSRTAAIGNLRENLARRRVLGSSFGQDSLTRAESEFAGQRDRVAAESFLQEFEMTNQLIQQQFAAKRGQFQTGLDELNLEAELGAKLAGGATNAMASNAKALAELNAKEAAGEGQFMGQLFGKVGEGLGAGAGKAVSSFFKPSAGSFGSSAAIS